LFATTDGEVTGGLLENSRMTKSNSQIHARHGFCILCQTAMTSVGDRTSLSNRL